MSAAADTIVAVEETLAPYQKQKRIMNFHCGKAQNAIFNLIESIKVDDDADIRTRLLFIDIRERLIIGLRAVQNLYDATAPPRRAPSPCPCGRGCVEDHD
jgi:hypothetical protein